MPHLVFIKDNEVVCELLGYPSNLIIDIPTLRSSIARDDNVVFKVEKKDSIVSLRKKSIEDIT